MSSPVADILTRGNILVDRLAESTLGVGDTLRDVTESIIESMGGTAGNGLSLNG